jgi:hypothetical protein
VVGRHKSSVFVLVRAIVVVPVVRGCCVGSRSPRANSDRHCSELCLSTHLVLIMATHNPSEFGEGNTDCSIHGELALFEYQGSREWRNDNDEDL